MTYHTTGLIGQEYRAASEDIKMGLGGGGGGGGQ